LGTARAACSCPLLVVLVRCSRCWTTAGSPTPQGHTVNFRMRWLIMTSNIGSEHLLDGVTGEVVVAVLPAVAIELVTNIGEG
jgi:hypothetical protein